MNIQLCKNDTSFTFWHTCEGLYAENGTDFVCIKNVIHKKKRLRPSINQSDFVKIVI